MAARSAGLLLVVGAAVAVLAALVPKAGAAAAAGFCRPSFPDRLDFRFCADAGGWVGGFADLPAAELDGDFYALSFRRAEVPRSRPGGRLLGLRLAGDNRSDDLFMYVKRQITGLAPNAAYTVRADFTLYTDAGRDCFGIGGAPGESVFVKAGAVPFEPGVVADANGDAVMNLDKGNQAQGGADAVVLGDLAAAGADCGGGAYVPKRFTTGRRGLVAETDGDGNLWVFVGTDSGFEGRTAYYLTHIRLAVRPR